MRRSLLPLVFLAALCGGCQQFEARDTVEFTIPLDGVTTIDCKSHNGGIQIEGVDGATEIKVVATKVARASSQVEADANLAAMRIDRQVADDRLRLRLKYEPAKKLGWGGSVAYKITAPTHLAAAAETHNGGIRVTKLRDRVDVKSHNGGIRVDGDFEDVNAITHNGAVRIDLRGDRTVSGKIETHNGGVTVAFGAGLSSRIEASTHNGGLSHSSPVELIERTKHAIEARVGKGDGRLRIGTHNGSVRLVGLKQ